MGIKDIMPIRYFKAEPNEYVRMSASGKAKKEGRGKSGLYLPFRTSIEIVSQAANDQGFVFQEISQDKQEITLQGGFVYKVKDAGKVLDLFNLSVDPQTRQYRSDDAEKIPGHILQLVQAEARKIVQDKPLEELLVMGDMLSSQVSAELMSEASKVAELGIELEMVYFSAVKARPEIAKALEAQYREQLLQNQDEAIYSRRAKAVEQERTIKENEMATEIKMEEEKEKLVELQSKNLTSEAQARADAKKIQVQGEAEGTKMMAEAEAEGMKMKVEAQKEELAIYKDLGAQNIAALGLYELGQHAENIGSLNVTPEVFAGIKDLLKD